MKTYADEYLGKSTSAAAVSSDSQVMMSSVTLVMTGSYTSLENFLDAVSGSGRCIVLASIQISQQNSVLTCNVVLQCYGAEKLDNSDSIFDWKLPLPSGKKTMM
jgi:Tfp pilus assembly protein PilO